MIVEYVTIIIVPLLMAITSIISYLVGYGRLLKIILAIVYGFMLGWSILLASLSCLGITLSAFGMEFRIDALSSIFILTSMIIAISCLIYSYHYMEYYVSKHGLRLKGLGLYYSLLTITILTVYLMAISNNAFILWVVVEATTLTTAFLVGYGRYEGALGEVDMIATTRSGRTYVAEIYGGVKCPKKKIDELLKSMMIAEKQGHKNIIGLLITYFPPLEETIIYAQEVRDQNTDIYVLTKNQLKEIAKFSATRL